LALDMIFPSCGMAIAATASHGQKAEVKTWVDAQ
jgi:hypothetical protein